MGHCATSLLLLTLLVSLASTGQAKAGREGEPARSCYQYCTVYCTDCSTVYCVLTLTVHIISKYIYLKYNGLIGAIGA